MVSAPHTITSDVPSSHMRTTDEWGIHYIIDRRAFSFGRFWYLHDPSHPGQRIEVSVLVSSGTDSTDFFLESGNEIGLNGQSGVRVTGNGSFVLEAFQGTERVYWNATHLNNSAVL